MSERYNKQLKKQSGIKNGIVGGIIGGATVALLGTGILFGSGTLEMSKDDVDMNKPVVTEEATSDSGTTNVSLNITTATTEAVESVQEAVVSVINLKQNAGNPFGFVIPQTGSSDDDDLVTNGTGSGVIYKKEDGTAYVVTNNHVISGADAVEVLMKDGTKIEAEIVGADVWTDLQSLRFRQNMWML